MQQFALEYVPAGAMTAEDQEWLKKADNAGPAYQRLSLDDIEYWLLKGEMHLFRYNPGPGVVLVEVRKGPNNLKRLGIVRTAGLGVIWTYAQVAQLLQHTAKEWGCQQIETMIYRPELARTLLRLGAKAEAVNIVLEV